MWLVSSNVACKTPRHRVVQKACKQRTTNEPVSFQSPAAMNLLSMLVALYCLYRLVSSAVPRAFSVGRGFAMLTYGVLCAVPWLVMLKIKVILFNRQEDTIQLCGMLLSFSEQFHKLQEDASNTQAAIKGNSFP